MSFWDAVSMAAAITIALIGFAANKSLMWILPSFSGGTGSAPSAKKCWPSGRGRGRGTNVQGEIRRAFDGIAPLGKADKASPRPDGQKFPPADGGADRTSAAAEALPGYPDDRHSTPAQKRFRHWNDDGREWRESVLQCSALERLLPKEAAAPSIHLPEKRPPPAAPIETHPQRDRAGKQKDYYAHKGTISCPSCGAEVELHSQQTVCPYCGGMIQSDFYDWQTEAFAVYEQMGANQEKALWLLFWGGILYACLFLCLWLIQNTLVSLAAGVGLRPSFWRR